MSSHLPSADVVGVGVVRPAANLVARSAPPVVANADWPAYRVDAETEAALTAGNARRLGRGQVLAMGAVKRAVERCASPDDCDAATAVSVGTATAEEIDEIAFLENVVKVGEKGSKPALFVNSVKNALASQIALQRGFRGENQTFVHDALSFEAALWQGLRVIDAKRVARVAVCGVDALSPFSEIQGHVLGHYRHELKPLAPLSPSPLTGTIPGEGAAAFVLAPRGQTATPLARILGVKARGSMCRMPALEAREEAQFIERAMSDIGVSLDAVDLVLFGANGDATLDSIYQGISTLMRARTRAAVGVYKHATGDYATASALGLALAVETIAARAIAPEVRVVDGGSDAPATVLLYHLTREGYRSVMVASRG